MYPYKYKYVPNTYWDEDGEYDFSYVYFQGFDITPNLERYILSGQGYWLEMETATHEYHRLFKVKNHEIDIDDLGIPVA